VLDENDIIEAVCQHLEQRGFVIRSRLSTSERGVDIVAVHRDTGEELLVEAKGGTSSKPSSKRFGGPFTQAQAKVHVAEAFYQVATKLSDDTLPARRVAMAFPATPVHSRLVEAIDVARRRLGVEVFFVDEDRRVHELRKMEGPR